MRGYLVWSILIAAIAAAGPARADETTETRADTLFRDGRDKMKTGDYVGACEQFTESNRLDPQPGTQFNIGLCSEKLGKLATASRIFDGLSAQDADIERRAKAVQWVKDLAPRIPKLAVTVSPATATGVVITLDGFDITASAAAGVPVDLGPHDLAVSATGVPAMHSRPDVHDEGKTLTVPVSLAPVDVGPPLTPAHGTSSRKRIGQVTLALGGVVLVNAVVFSALARSRWSQAKDACDGETICADGDKAKLANQLGDKARQRATIADVSYVVGGLAAAAGLVLWLTAPSDEHTVTATASSTSVGVTFSSRF